MGKNTRLMRAITYKNNLENRDVVIYNIMRKTTETTQLTACFQRIMFVTGVQYGPSRKTQTQTIRELN